MQELTNTKVYKIYEDIYNEKINLDKGSQDWKGSYLEITRLVWDRNMQEYSQDTKGYTIDVYTQQYGTHIGTIDIDNDRMPSIVIEYDRDAEYGMGGFLLGSAVGGYAGYKIGRARPQKKGFDTEKKIAREVKKEVAKMRAKKKDTKKSYATGGGVAKKEYVLTRYYVDVHEDSYEEGEIQSVHSWTSSDFEDNNKTFSQKNMLMYFIKEVVKRDTDYTPINPDDFEIEAHTGGATIWTDVLCKYIDLDRGYDRYEKATDDEIDQWKRGELKLFNVSFSFKVEVYEPRKRAEFDRGGETDADYWKQNKGDFAGYMEIDETEVDDDYIDRHFAKGGKVGRYTTDDMPKFLENIFGKEYIENVLIQKDQMDINFKDDGFFVGNRDIKAVEKKGWTFDSLSTYGTSGISLLFTRKSYAKGGKVCSGCGQQECEC